MSSGGDSWVARRVASVDTSLHVERAGRGTPVLILHGFTGTGRSMEPLASTLAAHHDAIRVDLVGHGRSGAPADLAAYSMAACVAQLVTVLDALELQRAHVVGYSMGGRVALSMISSHPERISSGFLIGASAGLGNAEQRHERVAADEALARRIEEDGLECFVDHWMALPLFASQRCLGEPALAAARAERLSQRPLGLANSLRGMGTGAQPALHERLGELHTPICLVAGELDAKFREIADDLAARLANARTAVINGAGHAAHLERPAEVGRAALEFFRRVDRSRSESPQSSRDSLPPDPNPATP